MRKQYVVSRAINGAILELMDVETNQRLSIIDHPKLQHIRHFLGAGVGVIDWSTSRLSDPETRWINTVACFDQPYKVIDIHGAWEDGYVNQLDDESDLVATLDEDWFAHPKVGRAFFEIKW